MHDLRKQASIVQDFRGAERVPWLERTGFPSHLRGMKDSKILSSYRLPSKKKELDGEANDAEDPELIRILQQPSQCFKTPTGCAATRRWFGG